jgi:hypothetical protein
MPAAPSLLAVQDRLVIARRVQACVRAILLERTGGRRGSMRAEVDELAAECGCSHSGIARLLGWGGALSKRGWGRSRQQVGIYLPRVDVLVRLAQVGRVSLDWLVLGTGKAPTWAHLVDVDVITEE